TFGTVEVPQTWASTWQEALSQWLRFDEARGEEGVSVQGSLLIALLVAIGFAAYKGMEDIVEGASRWTWVALALAATTLVAAAMRLTPHDDGLTVEITGRVVAVGLAICAAWRYAARLPADEWQGWLWEAWRFVKQI